MTRQTPAPLDRLGLSATNRRASELARMVTDGLLNLNPPYQRDDVWSDDQRIGLVRSWLIGLPIPAVILNDRLSTFWDGPNDYDNPYVCVDGKQRITTAVKWYADGFGVPASWWPAKDVLAPYDTDDGPYVRFSGLSVPAQRHMQHDALLATVEGKLPSQRVEAEVYMLVNGEGTPQTADDMNRAARIARGGK